MFGAFDAGTASARLILDLNEWSANIEKAKADTTSLAGVVAAKKEDIEKLGKAFTAAGVAIVGSLGMAMKSAMNFTLEAGRMADRTGIAVETISGLREAADDAEVTMDDLSGGFRRYSALVADAAGGNKAAQDTMKKLGVEIFDSSGKLKTMDELLLEAADRFSKMEGGAEKAALAQDMFGRGGAALIPLFNKGAEGIRAYTEDVRKSGQMITQEGVEKTRAFRIGMDNLDDAFMAVKLSIANALMPVVKTLAESFAFMVGTIRSALDVFPPLGNTITIVVGAVGALLAVLGPMLLLWTKLGPVITQIGAAIPILNTHLATITSTVGKVTLAAGALILAFQATTWACKKMQEGLDRDLANIMESTERTAKGWKFAGDSMKGLTSVSADSMKKIIASQRSMGHSAEEIGETIYTMFRLKIAAAAKQVARDVEDMAIKVANVQKELSAKIAEVTMNEYAFRIFQAKQYYADLKEKVKGSVDESKLFADIEKAQALEITKIEKEQAASRAQAHQTMIDKKKKADESFFKEFLSLNKDTRKSHLQLYEGMGITVKDAMRHISSDTTETFKLIDSKGREIVPKIKKSFSEIATSVGQYLQIMQQGMGQFFSALSAQSEQRLKKEIGRLDTEYQARKKQIENSLMSEKEKAAAMTALDEEFAQKKKVLEIKQAEANKKSGIAQAIVNTAIAVTSALSMKPFFPLGLIAAAMAAAAGYIQIRVIQNTPIPAMAEGGLINRPTHVLAGEAGPEAILPMRELRRMLGVNTKKHGAGARTVNVNISAIDASGMADFARRSIIPEIKRALVREELTVPPNAVR